MIVKFDNIEVNIKNEEIITRIKNFILRESKKKQKRVFTKEERERIQELYLAGENVKDIAEELNADWQAIKGCIGAWRKYTKMNPFESNPMKTIKTIEL